MKAQLKRQNFNVTPEQEAEINWLKEALDAPSTKDAVLLAVRTLAALSRETKRGCKIYLMHENGEKELLLIPELERAHQDEWAYLVPRPHSWRRQLYVKGRRLRASSVWSDMIVNEMSVDEVADDWDLPLEAVEEIVRYCEANRKLIGMEADEERRFLESRGVDLGD